MPAPNLTQLDRLSNSFNIGNAYTSRASSSRGSGGWRLNQILNRLNVRGSGNRTAIDAFLALPIAQQTTLASRARAIRAAAPAATRDSLYNINNFTQAHNNWYNTSTTSTYRRTNPPPTTDPQQQLNWYRTQASTNYRQNNPPPGVDLAAQQRWYDNLPPTGDYRQDNPRPGSTGTQARIDAPGQKPQWQQDRSPGRGSSLIQNYYQGTTRTQVNWAQYRTDHNYRRAFERLQQVHPDQDYDIDRLAIQNPLEAQRLINNANRYMSSDDWLDDDDAIPSNPAAGFQQPSRSSDRVRWGDLYNRPSTASLAQPNYQQRTHNDGSVHTYQNNRRVITMAERLNIPPGRTSQINVAPPGHNPILQTVNSPYLNDPLLQQRVTSTPTDGNQGRGIPTARSDGSHDAVTLSYGHGISNVSIPAMPARDVGVDPALAGPPPVSLFPGMTFTRSATNPDSWDSSFTPANRTVIPAHLPINMIPTTGGSSPTLPALPSWGSAALTYPSVASSTAAPIPPPIPARSRTAPATTPAATAPATTATTTGGTT